MTRIDFYLLPVAEAHGKLSFACRLAEKAYGSGCRVYLHSASEDEAQLLDLMLWGFRDSSFVPHVLLGADLPSTRAPVEIGHGEPPDDHHDVLINLASDVAPFFGRFDRVAEIVLNDNDCKQAGRRHWSFYRDRGYETRHHDMQNLGAAHGA